MIRSLRLTAQPIDSNGPLLGSRTAGAQITFLGIVREREGEAPISALHYEAFEAMAEYQFQKLFDQLQERWPQVESVGLIHRLGNVPVSEPSLRVEVSSPHRGEAFAACQWLIDEMKRVVPIWKRPVPLAPAPSTAPSAP